MEQYEVSTLKKGLLILDLLRREESMTLSEIKQKVSLNKSTAFRLLYTLELMGYVTKVNNVYSVTDKIGEKPRPLNAGMNWRLVSQLHQLSSEVGEIVQVGVLDGANIVTTQVVNGTNSIRRSVSIGESTPAHVSALGKVIMAFMNEQALEHLMKQLLLVKKTKNTFVDSHLLKEHLKVIRQQGYAVDNEETEMNLRCIAAPIIYKDEVIAAVSLSGASEDLTKKLDKRLSVRLIEYSTRIAKLL